MTKHTTLQTYCVRMYHIPSLIREGISSFYVRGRSGSSAAVQLAVLGPGVINAEGRPQSRSREETLTPPRQTVSLRPMQGGPPI